jgi:pimeloyl-ACP methyl ester carboxylesterase
VQTPSNTTYHTVQVNGLTIFYREAGPKDAPTILFLHGFPSSSTMFETLFPLLSARYRLIAPDYPGFGYSTAPDPHQFNYTFDHLAAIIDSFTAPHPERINPDTWTDEYTFLTRPGETQIQLDLFYDYQTNVAAYPVWQQWLRDHQPRLLVLWGRYDPSFTIAGAHGYKKHVPGAQVVLLDAGHFALDEARDQIATNILSFLKG